MKTINQDVFKIKNVLGTRGERFLGKFHTFLQLFAQGTVPEFDLNQSILSFNPGIQAIELLARLAGATGEEYQEFHKPFVRAAIDGKSTYAALGEGFELWPTNGLRKFLISVGTDPWTYSNWGLALPVKWLPVVGPQAQRFGRVLSEVTQSMGTVMRQGTGALTSRVRTLGQRKEYFSFHMVNGLREILTKALYRNKSLLDQYLPRGSSLRGRSLYDLTTIPGEDLRVMIQAMYDYALANAGKIAQTDDLSWTVIKTLGDRSDYYDDELLEFLNRIRRDVGVEDLDTIASDQADVLENILRRSDESITPVLDKDEVAAIMVDAAGLPITDSALQSAKAILRALDVDFHDRIFDHLIPPTLGGESLSNNAYTIIMGQKERFAGNIERSILNPRSAYHNQFAASLNTMSKVPVLRQILTALKIANKFNRAVSVGHLMYFLYGPQNIAEVYVKTAAYGVSTRGSHTPLRRVKVLARPSAGVRRELQEDYIKDVNLFGEIIRRSDAKRGVDTEGLSPLRRVFESAKAFGDFHTAWDTYEDLILRKWNRYTLEMEAAAWVNINRRYLNQLAPEEMGRLNQITPAFSAEVDELMEEFIGNTGTEELVKDSTAEYMLDMVQNNPEALNDLGLHLSRLDVEADDVLEITGRYDTSQNLPVDIHERAKYGTLQDDLKDPNFDNIAHEQMALDSLFSQVNVLNRMKTSMKAMADSPITNKSILEKRMQMIHQGLETWQSLASYNAELIFQSTFSNPNRSYKIKVYEEYWKNIGGRFINEGNATLNNLIESTQRHFQPDGDVFKLVKDPDTLATLEPAVADEFITEAAQGVYVQTLAREAERTGIIREVRETTFNRTQRHVEELVGIDDPQEVRRRWLEVARRNNADWQKSKERLAILNAELNTYITQIEGVNLERHIIHQARGNRVTTQQIGDLFRRPAPEVTSLLLNEVTRSVKSKEEVVALILEQAKNVARLQKKTADEFGWTKARVGHWYDINRKKLFTDEMVQKVMHQKIAAYQSMKADLSTYYAAKKPLTAETRVKLNDVGSRYLQTLKDDSITGEAFFNNARVSRQNIASLSSGRRLTVNGKQEVLTASPPNIETTTVFHGTPFDFNPQELNFKTREGGLFFSPSSSEAGNYSQRAFFAGKPTEGAIPRVIRYELDTRQYISVTQLREELNLRRIGNEPTLLREKAQERGYKGLIYDGDPDNLFYNAFDKDTVHFVSRPGATSLPNSSDFRFESGPDIVSLPDGTSLINDADRLTTVTEDQLLTTPPANVETTTVFHGTTRQFNPENIQSGIDVGAASTKNPDIEFQSGIFFTSSEGDAVAMANHVGRRIQYELDTRKYVEFEQLVNEPSFQQFRAGLDYDVEDLILYTMTPEFRMHLLERGIQGVKFQNVGRVNSFNEYIALDRSTVHFIRKPGESAANESAQRIGLKPVEKGPVDTLLDHTIDTVDPMSTNPFVSTRAIQETLGDITILTTGIPQSNLRRLRQADRTPESIVEEASQASGVLPGELRTVYDMEVFVKRAADTEGLTGAQRQILKRSRDDMRYMNDYRERLYSYLKDKDVRGFRHPNGSIHVIDDTVLEEVEIASRLSAPPPIEEKILAAQKRTNEDIDLLFQNYNQESIVSTVGRFMFPFWTYETHRAQFIPQLFAQNPKLFGIYHKYWDYSDNGYFKVYGTPISLNFLRGGIFLSGFKNIIGTDFPEFNDQYPGISGAVKNFEKFGFYFNPLIYGLIATPLFNKEREAQYGTVLPALTDIPLQAASIAFPESEALRTIRQELLPNRFRDVLTATFAAQNGDPEHIKRILIKLRNKEDLSEIDEEAWAKGVIKANLFMAFNAQVPFGRYTADKARELQTAKEQAIFNIYGIAPEYQRALKAHGMSIFDVLPPTAQYFEELDRLDDTDFVGLSNLLAPSSIARILITQKERSVDFENINNENKQQREEINDLLAGGLLTGGRWIRARREILGKAKDSKIALDESKYTNLPKTFAERTEAWQNAGAVAPYTSNETAIWEILQERDIEDFTRIDPVHGRVVDEEGYYEYIRLIFETADPQTRLALETAFRDTQTPTDLEYFKDIDSYLLPYRNIDQIVLSTYSREEQELIEIERVTNNREEKARIHEIITSNGDKLISGYNRKVSQSREVLRRSVPELDATLYFWEKTNTFLTPRAENIYDQRRFGGKSIPIPETIQGRKIRILLEG